MSFVKDQGSVEEFSAQRADHAFADRVCPGRRGWAFEYADASVGQDGVGAGGELPAAISSHELEEVGTIAEVHEEMAGGLGGPRSIWVGGGAEQVNPAGAVLDES